VLGSSWLGTHSPTTTMFSGQESGDEVRPWSICKYCPCRRLTCERCAKECGKLDIGSSPSPSNLGIRRENSIRGKPTWEGSGKLGNPDMIIGKSSPHSYGGLGFPKSKTVLDGLAMRSQLVRQELENMSLKKTQGSKEARFFNKE